MDKKDLWIVSTKSQRMKDCSLDDDGSEFYHVECLIPADSLKEASGTIEHLLRDKQMELYKILKCEIYDPELWKSTEQYSQIKQAAEYAKAKGEPKFALWISSEAMDFEEKEESGNDEVDWD